MPITLVSALSWKRSSSAIDDERARGLEVFAGREEAPARTNAKSALDLNRPQTVARNLQAQVDLRSDGRPVGHHR